MAGQWRLQRRLPVRADGYGCAVALSREDVLADLAAADGLWPLINACSCELCAQPRRPQYARWPRCARCNEHSKCHGKVITTLQPITYTAYDWCLGAGLREFKARGCALSSRWALGFGAVLSAYLEHQLPLTGRGRRDLIVTVPTTAPVIAAALARAGQEGWWTPDVASVGGIAPGFERQRERDPKARSSVPVEKWLIDDAALNQAQEVVLLDDMMSSGGTIFSFAAALRRHGVAFVDAIVVARNVGHRDGDWILPLLRERVAAGQPWRPEDSMRDVIRS